MTSRSGGICTLGMVDGKLTMMIDQEQRQKDQKNKRPINEKKRRRAGKEGTDASPSSTCSPMSRCKKDAVNLPVPPPPSPSFGGNHRLKNNEKIPSGGRDPCIPYLTPFG